MGWLRLATPSGKSPPDRGSRRIKSTPRRGTRTRFVYEAAQGHTDKQQRESNLATQQERHRIYAEIGQASDNIDQLKERIDDLQRELRDLCRQADNLLRRRMLGDGWIAARDQLNDQISALKENKNAWYARKNELYEMLKE